MANEVIIGDIDEPNRDAVEQVKPELPTQEAILAAEEAVTEAAAALDRARSTVLAFKRQQQTARARSAAALQAWLAFFRVSPAQNIQNYLAGEHAKRVEMAANGQLGPADDGRRPGPSALDRAAFFSKGGSIDQGHGNFRRGGKSLQQLAHDRARLGLPPLPVAKPISSR